MPRRCGGRLRLSRACCDSAAVVILYYCAQDSEDRTVKYVSEDRMQTGAGWLQRKRRVISVLKLIEHAVLSQHRPTREDGTKGGETDVQKHNGCGSALDTGLAAQFRGSKEPDCWVVCKYPQHTPNQARRYNVESNESRGMIVGSN
jgi:hypothetical protein